MPSPKINGKGAQQHAYNNKGQLTTVLIRFSKSQGKWVTTRKNNANKYNVKFNASTSRVTVTPKRKGLIVPVFGAILGAAAAGLGARRVLQGSRRGNSNPVGAPAAPKPATVSGKPRTSTPGKVTRLVQQFSTFNRNAAKARAEHLRESGNNPGNLPLTGAQLAATALVGAAGAAALSAAPRFARAPKAAPGPTSAETAAALKRYNNAQRAIRNTAARAASRAGEAARQGIAPSRPRWH